MMSASNVTSSTTTTKVSPNIRFDPSYIKTLPGMVKIATVVVSLIGFICVQVVTYGYVSSAAGWYSFVSMTSFWVQLITIFFYLFHIIERLHFIPWLIGELGFSGLWTIFFFIAACVVVSKAGYDAAWGAAAFFGFLAMAIYGFETYLKFKGWRAGEIAQGERTVTTNTTTSPTGPSYPTY